MQPCQVSRISRESRAFSVHASPRAKVLSHAFHLSICYTISFGNNDKWFSLVSTSEFKMHKNALMAGATPAFGQLSL